MYVNIQSAENSSASGDKQSPVSGEIKKEFSWEKNLLQFPLFSQFIFNIPRWNKSPYLLFQENIDLGSSETAGKLFSKGHLTMGYNPLVVSRC